NLIKGLGHVIEYPMSIFKYLGQNEKVYYIGNKKVQSNVRRNFPCVKGLITDTCFKDLESKGKKFLTDLEKLNSVYHFTNKDLIVVLTAYWNEVSGAKLFVTELGQTSPSFILWIHQLFPPEKDFKETLKPQYIKDTYSNWKDVTSNLPINIKLAVPPVITLKKALNNLCGKEILSLPFPYEYRESHTKRNNVRCKSIAFLGDGRYEKGLIYLIADSLIRKGQKYYIQNLNPRGYSAKEKKYFKDYIKKLSRHSNVTIYNKPFFPNAFVQMLSKYDLIVLPYLPESYDKRGSGIYVQAAQHGIPCVVTEGTWMGEEVKKQGNGIIFNYTESRNIKENSIILSKAIDSSINNFKRIKEKALESQSYYLNEYSAKTFLSKLN
ncbi:MAG TPA: glycosyltransferase, partial [Candidatus Dojkabacteria bacterium]|nr:glycosyltransferase [Candidatus Dojkabacteria bacterium]